MKVINRTKELITEHIVTSLLVLLSLLFGSLWLASKPVFYECILPAIAKETLAALLAGTIVLLLMVLAYTIYLHKELKSKMFPRFGMLWSKKTLVPHCPACSTPLSNYGNYRFNEGDKFALQCMKCKVNFQLVDDNGNTLELKTAKQILEKSKP